MPAIVPTTDPAYRDALRTSTTLSGGLHLAGGRRLGESRSAPGPTCCVVARSGSTAVNPVEHGAKGLCQERAFVCGLEAANSLLRRGVVKGTGSASSQPHAVLPIRADEPQVVLGRALNKLVMDPLEAAGIRWPWLAS